jgi:glycosyltransferase involved in cell wall biosynthesis
MPMKILYMHGFPPEQRGGSALAERELLHALRSRHEVTFIPLQTTRSRFASRLHLLLQLPFLQLRAYLAAPGHWNTVIVSQPYSFLLFAYLRVFHPSIARIHRSHGFEFAVIEKTSRPQSLLRRLLQLPLDCLQALLISGSVRLASSHIVSNPLCRDYLARRYGIDPERVFLLAQAVQQEAPSSEAPSKRIPGSILFVGQLAQFKRVDVAIASMQRARALGLATECHVVTNRASLESLPLYPSPEVISVHDWLGEKDLRRLYESCEMIVVPSEYEGFSRVTAEAMRHGCVPFVNDTVGASFMFQGALQENICRQPDFSEWFVERLRRLAPADMAALRALATQSIESARSTNSAVSPAFERFLAAQ